MNDTSDIGVWLAVMAIASLVQTILLCAVAFVAWRSARQAQAAVKRFEQQRLDPLMMRVQEAVEGVRDVTVRVGALDRDVRDKVANATDHARDVAGKVATRMWPALAIGRAAYAAVSSFRRRETGRPLL